MTFKNLGLLIVDEEHRFGVMHKESLKRTYGAVDILSLSATPIPRTLAMALRGLRSISVLSTPLEDRLPVTTFAGGRRLTELDRQGGSEQVVGQAAHAVGAEESCHERIPRR